jgi:hypothetical protein
MNIEIKEIIKNNYIIDFSGMGCLKEHIGADPDQIKEQIQDDINNSFECVTYLNTLVNLKESIEVDKPSYLSINIYLKVLECNDANMFPVISKYITNTFLK